MRYWVLGEFRSGELAIEAIRALRALGYERLEGYTPYPVDGMDEVLRFGRSPVRWAGLAAGGVGAALAYLLQWFANVYDYPLDIGARPLDSWPTFVPICFETLELSATFAILATLLWLCGLPRPHHPVFECDSFRSVTVDRFWVSVTTEQPDRVDRIRDSMRTLEAGAVEVIAEDEEKEA